MSEELEGEIKRWTAKRRTVLVLQIIRGETTVNEAARQYDLRPSDVQHCTTPSLALVRTA